MQIVVQGSPPHSARPGDAGMDLVATQSLTLAPMGRALVPTGVSIALPPGYLAWITPRSGLAIKHGISMVNAPGVIDAGYRGEISVVLWNTDPHEPFEVVAGERIAQMIVTPHSVAHMVQVDSLPGSHRGEGGFGSTGTTETAGETP